MKLLLARGADPNDRRRKLTDLGALSRERREPRAAATSRSTAARSGTAAAAAAPRPCVAGVDRQHLFNELVACAGRHDAAALRGARRDTSDVAMALLDAGVDVNQRKGGDHASPLLVATVNGHFDLAAHAARARRQPEPRGRERRRAALRRDQPDVGAASRLSAAAGAPRIRRLSYLDFMKRLLDAGRGSEQRV